MTPTKEIEAKNVKEAVKKACTKLNIPRSDLKYDIVSYGSSGIFGLGRSKKAKIRVTLPQTSVPDQSAETEVASNNNSDVKSRVQSLIRETFSGKSTQHQFPEDPEVLGQDVLKRIVDTISNDAEISVESNANKLSFKVSGGDSAILIGKHGQTLEAMQSLVEKIVNKHNPERIRVEVDVEGYLENRRNNLVRHAERMAKKCKRIRKPVTVGYMNAHDRRIIHLALKEDQAIRTHSMGDGFLRKLMIFPSKSSARKQRSQ
jgi:spoIIIJ-associated protein